MPLYTVSDENVLALLKAAGCEVEVDQGEGQCYYVSKTGAPDVRVPVRFGASVSEFHDATVALADAAPKAAVVE